ncbi:sugar phosphate isomerase/epimerase family protein [Paenibacillus sp. OAS669]|uniref:sugar phosphate isomerase/epimerase family protein n=1 Tax=Paenibacillus sp. OAS669 TaxID=2663821 RepID=UPI00178919D7|nr:sugar phosphate isomerase/epimerase [Paenibacillus sp. OAS669]MBE1446805.1 sugar phosphate isomerase/epimerase [Paenibacillus sp. OAS669]
MGKPKFGVSGSTILSNPERLEELFWDDIDQIEIGEFPDERAFEQFLELARQKGVPYGVHSPLLRSGSKYDLIQHVYMEPEEAWKRLEAEVCQLSRLGAQYVLVHFPYFKEELPPTEDVHVLIEQGLQRLHSLQEKYSIPLVCEPKLGWNRSAVGIEYLHHFPVEVWEKYSISLCIDIGDYLMATGDRILSYLAKWRNHIKSVHLHNVELVPGHYHWIPVHPSHETNGRQYPIQELIRFLAECEDVVFIFEHTPHGQHDKAFIQSGYEWIRKLAEGR